MWTISKDKTWTSLQKRFEWVEAMHHVPQDGRHHAEGNVAIHTQMVLAALQNDQAYLELDLESREILWTAALLHDVEKRSTTVIEADGSITANGHARRGAQKARQILYRDVVTPFAIREQIVGLVRYHGLPLWVFEKPNPLKALIMASLDVNTQWLSMLARADVLGRICTDKADMLYRIDCFDELCRDNGCWGKPYQFVNEHALMNYMQKQDAQPDYVPFEVPAFEVVLLSGLPGAGKDMLIKRNYANMPVISLDDIRIKWGIKPTDKSGNGRVIQEAKEQARVLLRKQTGFIWNATNITLQMRSQLIELFISYKARVKIAYLEVPYADLQKQNRDREAIVPIGVLERLIDKLEVPAPWEAHQVHYRIK